MKERFRKAMQTRKFPESVITTAISAVEFSETPTELAAEMLNAVESGQHPKEIVKLAQPPLRKHLGMD